VLQLGMPVMIYRAILDSEQEGMNMASDGKNNAKLTPLVAVFTKITDTAT
jgi:hypothetical protein